MADKWPLADGNYSTAANWNDGTLPAIGDDVYLDGRTIVLDQDITVLSVRNTQRTGGTIGGSFTVSSNRTITATIFTRDSVMFTFTGTPTLNIVGQVWAGAQNTFNMTINTGGVTVNILGNIFPATSSTGGAVIGNGSFISLTGNSTVTITGNVNGSWTGGSNRHVIRQYAGLINITGTLTADSRAGGQWNMCLDFFGGTLVVNGDCIGGGNTRKDCPAIGTINGTSYGTITVTGQCIARSSPAIITMGSAGGAGARVITNGNWTAGSAGAVPIQCNELLIQSGGTLQHEYRVNNAGSPGVARSLYTGGVNLGQPTVANVRQGTVYGASNEFTGTLAVADPAYVSLGVPTDNTVGTLQHLTLTQLQQALSPNAAVAVERSIDDTKAITFSWPVSGATITGQKSIDNGTYSAVEGGISFLRTESGRHYYTLAYAADDRTDEEATIRYKMTDGTYTKYFNLRLVPPGITTEQIESSTVLAKEATVTDVGVLIAAVGTAVTNRPTLAQIEESTVLAKADKLNDVNEDTQEIINLINTKPDLTDIEQSEILSKQITSDDIKEDTEDIQQNILVIKDILDNPETPEKVMVNQDFGGEGNLTYTLNGDPVADALIELFLYSDYAAGDYNSNRLDSTRQRIDGTWAKAFYLDPQEYVIRFYRTGVAGPDAYKIVVSFDEDEIEVTPL